MPAWPFRVASEVGVRGDNATPARDHFRGLIGQHLARKAKITFVVAVETHALLQKIQLLQGDRRGRNLGGSIGVAGNRHSLMLHGPFSSQDQYRPRRLLPHHSKGWRGGPDQASTSIWL